MARSTQPYINWNNKVQPLDRSALPEPPAPVLDKSLAAKIHGASCHPWGMIDHHLYLAAIERGRDFSTRLNSCMLYEGERFRQVVLDDHLDTHTDNHLITFINMPLLPLSTLCPLTEQKLVLGFDLQRQYLQGYFFESAPDDLTDLCYVWHERQLVIDIPVDRFLEMYQYAVENSEICGEGMFRYFRESKCELPTGMDLVVTVQFAQFLNDFVELWGSDAEIQIHADSEEHLRTLLSKASYESWFAVRDGLTCQKYRQKKMNNQLACDLLFDRASASVPNIPPVPYLALNPSTSVFQMVVSEQLRNIQKQMCKVFFVLIYLFALIPKSLNQLS